MLSGNSVPSKISCSQAQSFPRQTAVRFPARASVRESLHTEPPARADGSASVRKSLHTELPARARTLSGSRSTLVSTLRCGTSSVTMADRAWKQPEMNLEESVTKCASRQ